MSAAAPTPKEVLAAQLPPGATVYTDNPMAEMHIVSAEMIVDGVLQPLPNLDKMGGPFSWNAEYEGYDMGSAWDKSFVTMLGHWLHGKDCLIQRDACYVQADLTQEQEE